MTTRDDEYSQKIRRTVEDESESDRRSRSVVADVRDAFAPRRRVVAIDRATSSTPSSSASVVGVDFIIIIIIIIIIVDPPLGKINGERNPTVRRARRLEGPAIMTDEREGTTGRGSMDKAHACDSTTPRTRTVGFDVSPTPRAGDGGENGRGTPRSGVFRELRRMAEEAGAAPTRGTRESGDGCANTVSIPRASEDREREGTWGR